MNKFYLFVALLLFGVSQAQAQKSNVPDVHDQIMPGTVTLLSGKVIKGYVRSNGRSQNQNMCEFYLDQNDPDTYIQYHPNELLGYTVANNRYDSMPYRGSSAMIGHDSVHSYFIYLLKDGPVSTYMYWDGAAPVLLWRRGNQEPMGRTALKLAFQNNMLKLIAGDTELATRIQQEDSSYQIANINNIISEYNSRATSKKMVASN